MRETVSDWLGYIPTTFPHYTRHSIAHSDEIIKELSGLIFVDYDPAQPISPFSSMELYVLAAGAYLHDAGMVVSDAEKASLLDSSEWAEWTGEGPASARWRAIQEIRKQAGNSPAEAAQAHFAADLQTRYLIAEYIRRKHHERVDVLRDQPTLLSKADLGDPSLRKTIVDVCVAHGLTSAELAMDERYPTRRDIRGSPVDVRFMAILLRLGDLLDLSHDRGCPLLLNAASPLPAGSIAHWQQYQRIVHRVTSPDRLELQAECETQEEHRLLRDWCQWIEDEARDAQLLMRGSDRHGGWQPPNARLADPDPTFTIKPSSSAKYVPVDWRIESDPATILGRLSSDIYSSDLAFLRELLQNALDASRCRVFAEQGSHSQSDGWWTAVALKACREIPVEVSLESFTKSDAGSGIEKVKQVISVSDQGIGMDTERVQQYLLHAGRSFYDSAAFRKQYGFVAASRFGVGFLSVFGVSDRVEVWTKARGRGQTTEYVSNCMVPETTCLSRPQTEGSTELRCLSSYVSRLIQTG
ncbi:MAG TPA: ATP-binding protein [Solirubrobacterales bacterium]|nr:ATP-binding protein [Solirubrobacterales bacterium]